MWRGIKGREKEGGLAKGVERGGCEWTRLVGGEKWVLGRCGGCEEYGAG